MKKLLAGILLLAACTREKDETLVNPLIVGKWKLERTVEEDYQPIHTLLESDETLGKPGDSIVFRANNTVMSYTDGGDAEEDEYKFLNDSTVSIEFETYKIRKLTDTELYLHAEEIDNALDEKWIYKIYLVR